LYTQSICLQDNLPQANSDAMCTRNEISRDPISVSEPTFIMQEKASSTTDSSDSTSRDMTEKTAPAYLSASYEPKEIRKVVREAILLAGGAVSILLQVANPGVGQGVNEHSNFAYRPVDRLRTTMTYVYGMSYGTPAEKRAIVAMVERAHTPIHGPNYDANDPELQLWVAATLYAAGVDIYEKFFGKLDERTSEQVYQEYAVLATSLRVPQAMWPANRAKFWEYWDAQIANMEVSPHAKKVASDLLRDNKGPLWLKMNLPFIRVLTAEWMPPHLRDAYGLTTSAPKRGLYRVSMMLGRHIYPHLPLFIREYPKNYYMKDMRKRLRKEMV